MFGISLVARKVLRFRSRLVKLVLQQTVWSNRIDIECHTPLTWRSDVPTPDSSQGLDQRSCPPALYRAADVDWPCWWRTSKMENRDDVVTCGLDSSIICSSRLMVIVSYFYLCWRLTSSVFLHTGIENAWSQKIIAKKSGIRDTLHSLRNISVRVQLIRQT